MVGNVLYFRQKPFRWYLTDRFASNYEDSMVGLYHNSNLAYGEDQKYRVTHKRATWPSNLADCVTWKDGTVVKCVARKGSERELSFWHYFAQVAWMKKT